LKEIEEASDKVCHFCATTLSEESESCLECGALQSLVSLKTFEDRVEGDSARWQAFVDDVEATEYQADLTSCYRLGLAKMNLGQYEAALTVLKHALWLRPEDAELRGMVEELERAERRNARDAVSGSGRTVLIVDDNANVRELVTRTLEARSYRVRTASDGYEAIDVLRDHGAPDLILLDVAMPGLDGFHLCKLLRENPDTARLPIVMMSERDGLFGKLRGSMAGSTDSLSKPFEAKSLVKVVERHCLGISGRVKT
jgi:twitching motility two-component system response regulator PilG